MQYSYSHQLLHFGLLIVPPDVVPLANNQTIVGKDVESAVLVFRIDRAAPPVLEENLRWFYTPDPEVSDPFTPWAAIQEITGLTNRTSVSTLTFSALVNDMITLTVSQDGGEVTSEY